MLKILQDQKWCKARCNSVSSFVLRLHGWSICKIAMVKDWLLCQQNISRGSGISRCPSSFIIEHRWPTENCMSSIQRATIWNLAPMSICRSQTPSVVHSFKRRGSSQVSYYAITGYPGWKLESILVWELTISKLSSVETSWKSVLAIYKERMIWCNGSPIPVILQDISSTKSIVVIVMDQSDGICTARR